MATYVVKVGTSTLLDVDGRPSATFETIARSIDELRQSHKVVLVTSGAIGFGMRYMQLGQRPAAMPELQALSMLGQVDLLDRWRSAFADEPVGQVLVTRRELHRDTDTQAFKESIAALWHYGAVPIVNENDAVATEEISFGDNDRLAAEIAVCLQADALFLLTDQDGIQENFGTASQRRIVSATADEIASHVVTTVSDVSRGGAVSKLAAARIATAAGIDTYIAKATQPQVVALAVSGQVGTKIVQ